MNNNILNLLWSTWPNRITLLRLVLLPILVTIFYLPYEYNRLLASIIFIIAALSDALDGYLARRLNQCSEIGALLDLLADKLLVTITLILLIEYHSYLWLTLPSLLIIIREIIITSLREWTALQGIRLKASWAGKWKTILQMSALALLLTNIMPWFNIGVVLLYLATLLTLWSLWLYIKQYYDSTSRN